MAYTNGALKYGIAAAQSDLPLSLGSSTLPRPVASKQQLVSLATQSGAQGPNGQINFNIATGAGAGYLKRNSAYLKCRVTCTFGAAANAEFSLPSKSASSIVNKLTVSVGGQVVNQINNYHLLHEMLLTHTTSKNYYDVDSSIFQYTGIANPFVAAAAGDQFVDVVIPLIAPIFNSEKSFPLFLLNAPVFIQLDINNIANAFKGDANLTNYSVSNAQLVFEQIYVDEQLMNGMKAMLQQGNLYQVHMADFHTLTTASSASLNYQIGANYSSVLGVLYTQVKNAPAVDADTVLLANTQTDFKLLIDGRQINNFPLNNRAQIFAEMNRCLSNMFDPNSTSNCTAANYLTTKFSGGVSTNRFNEEMAMTGQPAQNINVELYSAGGAFNTYIVVLFNQIVAIDANGGVTLIK